MISIEKKLSLIKIFAFVCIFIALFFSYQLPASIQKTVRIILMGMSLVSLILVTLHPKEQHKKVLNLSLLAMIILTVFLYSLG